MADELNAITHKVVHRSDKRRRQTLFYLRIGGCVVLLLVVYLLWAATQSDKADTKTFRREQARLKQLEGALLRYQEKMRQLNARIVQQELVRVELQQKLEETSNELVQSDKMREIEKQRRKRYAEQFEASEKTRQSLEDTLQNLRLDYERLATNRQNQEPQHSKEQEADKVRGSSYNNQEQLESHRKSDSASKQQPMDAQEKESKRTKKRCSNLAPCIKECMNRGFSKVMWDCQRQCLSNYGWTNCVGRYFDIGNWLGGSQNSHNNDF